MDDFNGDILSILFILMLIFGFPNGKEEMRKFLKGNMKEHGYKNCDKGIDDQSRGHKWGNERLAYDHG